MKKLILSLYLILAVGLYSFAQNWSYLDKQNNLQLTYSYTFSNQGTDTSLQVWLLIKDRTNNLTYDYGTITLDKSNVLDSVALGTLIKNKYVEILAKVGSKALPVHLSSFSQMVKNIRDSLPSVKQRSFAYQGLFMFQSAMSGILRDTKGTGNINFTVSGSYIVAISSFVCKEDVLIDIAAFRTFLNDRKKWDTKNVGIDYYLGALAGVGNVTLNMVQITNLLNEYFAKTAPFAKWPQGGQCGCCGNYSGNCYYWSEVCLAHDMACQRCQHSWCFSGCVASSCSGNSISWYWYLV